MIASATSSGREHAGVEHQVVDRQVGDVDAVERQVAVALDLLALGVLGQGLLDRDALAARHPARPGPSGAQSIQTVTAGRPSLRAIQPGEPRLDDDVALGGPFGEPGVELDVDRRMGGDVSPELGQGHPLLGGHGPEHLAPGQQLEREVSGDVLVDAVVVPDPGGPETVISNGRRRGDGSGREGLEQRLALLVAQAPDATGVGDADLFHGPAGADLADARQATRERPRPSSCRPCHCRRPDRGAP